MANSIRLSKSRFNSGEQCHLRLWYEIHDRELATDFDEQNTEVLSTDHRLFELVRRRYREVHHIEHDQLHFDEALAETQQVLEEEKAPALYGAAFEHKGLSCRVDLICRFPKGGWHLIEVKSTIKCTDRHVHEAAFKLEVLRGTGMDVRRVSVMTLNKGYVYNGVRLNLSQLFKLHPVTSQAKKHLESIGEKTKDMRKVILRGEPPEIDVGDQCFKPYRCPFYEHCAQDVVSSDHGLDELPRLRGQRLRKLQDAGIGEIRDIPKDYKLTRDQEIVRQAVNLRQSVILGDIKKTLAPLQGLVHYLDFETYSPVIPRFEGTSPFHRLPFLFSVHARHKNGKVTHLDYQHEGETDPRPNIADHLIKTLGTKGRICTYSAFEKGVLNQLAEEVPSRARELHAIIERLFDLLAAIRECYYDPDFRGSYSIKSVLPVLVPESGYEDLEIAGGGLASAMYLQALDLYDMDEKQRIFKNLRDYCERDTFAMVEIHKALKSLKGKRITIPSK